MKKEKSTHFWLVVVMAFCGSLLFSFVSLGIPATGCGAVDSDWTSSQ